mgnify:CR=1 FL=1
MEKLKEYTNPEYYENRELSWIKFNGRVLNEARDKSIPLLERLKFVSITSSNLDEFFMVRVASLKDMVHPGKDALVLIGPEGDFSEEEVRRAAENGFIPISLGKSRLRTETAALVACHILNLQNQ